MDMCIPRGVLLGNGHERKMRRLEDSKVVKKQRVEKRTREKSKLKRAIGSEHVRVRARTSYRRLYVNVFREKTPIDYVSNCRRYAL